MAPSRKNVVRKESRARSRSPPTRPQSRRIREGLTSRETRHSSTLSSRDHRIPIDCPLPGCNATTVHQHYNNLQFFNPHPANEIRYRGYVSSHRATSAQPNFANGEQAMLGQEAFGPGISDDEAAQELDEEGQTSLTGADETNDKDKPIGLRTLTVTPRVAAPEEGNDAQKSVTSADLPQEQQDVVILDGTASEDYSMMDEGTSDLTPGDPITSRRTLDFVEDLVNPLQTIPMEIHYETIANASDSKEEREQREESPVTASRGLQKVFDEWLVPGTLEQGSETLPWDIDGLDNPVHSLKKGEVNPELPSKMMRPAPDPYILQFQGTTEDEDDFEAIVGHSRKD